MTNSPNTQSTSTTQDSFLTEDQLQGKAKGEIDLISLDEAINNVSTILNPEIVKIYHEKPEEEWPTTPIEVYNHELKQIVPAGIGQTIKGNPRTVCGLTGSKKISIGRKESLERYYHIQTKTKAETIEQAEQNKNALSKLPKK